MELCTMCPRACGVNRDTSVGFCGEKNEFRIARAGLHAWEEPCISGTRGCGAVFFTGCNMRCVFCQNSEISQKGMGKIVSAERLTQIFYELKAAGAHNINLVTPTHYICRLAPLLEDAPLPVVWNSSGYESVSSLRLLEGKVSVFLPDLKFSQKAVAQKYAGAPDYFEMAQKAIVEMFRQTGPYQKKNGLLVRGVLIRHLILPENMENTFGVIDWVSRTFRPGEVLFSLMSQYTPYTELPFEELNRRITKKEYITSRNYMLKKGITEGFVQELSSAKEEYTPAFDFSGV